jgi:hypothetical protein
MNTKKKTNGTQFDWVRLLYEDEGLSELPHNIRSLLRQLEQKLEEERRA